MLVSGIPIALAVFSGLIVAVLQAATSVQEQTSAYLVKFLSLVISLIVCGPWFAKMLMDFIRLCLLNLSGSLLSLS